MIRTTYALLILLAMCLAAGANGCSKDRSRYSSAQNPGGGGNVPLASSAPLLPAGSSEWPDGAAVPGLTKIRQGYETPVVATANDSFMPTLAIFPLKSSAGGTVVVERIVLLVRDASQIETVLAENDFVAGTTEVAFGYFTTTPWFGAATFTPDWTTHPATPGLGKRVVFTSNASQPDANLSEVFHVWLAGANVGWPRPTLDASLRQSSREIGVRVRLNLSQGLACHIGLDRYASATTGSLPTEEHAISTTHVADPGASMTTVDLVIWVPFSAI